MAEGFKAIIADPEFQKNMANLGLTVEYLGPKETQAKWLTDSQILAKTLKETGVLERTKAQKK